MTLTRSLPTQDPSGLPITDTRRVMSGLVARNADGTPRAGVFPSGGDPIVTGTTGMSYSVAPFRAATSRVNTGVELIANDAAATVATTAAPAANSRIDAIWVRAQFQQHTDPGNIPVFGVTQGTAAAIPSKPSIPAGALELATAEVLSSTTQTSTTVITQTAPLTAAAGGAVPVRNDTELAAYNAADGTLARDMATGTLYSRESGAWVLLFAPLRPWTPTVTGLSLGNGALRTTYSKRDRIIEFFIEMESGSSTAATGPVGFTVPEPVAEPAMHRHVGEGYFRYTGSNNAWPVQPRIAGGSVININMLDASGGLLTFGSNLSNSTPTGSPWGGPTIRPTLYVHGTYVAAA